jgi:DNA-binding XRE family transcriptional regulator
MLAEAEAADTSRQFDALLSGAQPNTRITIPLAEGEDREDVEADLNTSARRVNTPIRVLSRRTDALVVGVIGVAAPGRIKSNRPEPVYDDRDERYLHGLARIRRQRNLSQAELAERAFTHKETVSMWERKRSIPTGTSIRRLVVALNLTEEQIPLLFDPEATLFPKKPTGPFASITSP